MSDKQKPEKEQDEPLSNEQKKLLEKLAEIAGRPEAPPEEKSEKQEDAGESKKE
jgi:hypothetical protein